jgi:hypothetical protein
LKRSSESPASESRAARSLREAFESGRPIIYVRSSEEQRVAAILAAVGSEWRHGGALPVWTWSLTEGMHRGRDSAVAGNQSARDALEFVAAHGGPGIFHLKDFHEPLRASPEIRRRLRDLHETCLEQRKHVVITSPIREIPAELERSILLIELRIPDILELLDFLRMEAAKEAPGMVASETVFNQVAGALRGLTLDEARYAMRRALAAHGTLGPESMPLLLEEKRLLIDRSGIVQYVPEATGLAEVGGLEALKEWLVQRRKLFQLRDTLNKDITPKGILIMGVPGCGKSLSVKAIASCFELPLYRVDMTEVFSGRHGKPEGAFVEACRMMEEMAPAVLWFDEIEMGITSEASGGEQGRIFAFFLTWMQEKNRGLFVAATANRIDLLPAEMIRKGRFDEVFFVDLPNKAEQIDIFRIHLNRRGVDAALFDLDQLTQFTVGWTGAEIEQCVISAATKASIEEREMTQQDLINMAVKLVPLSRTMKEQIGHIRGWAFERAVRATPGPVGR